MDSLRNLELSDRAWMESLIALNPSDSCEDSFANLLVWNCVYAYKVCDFHGRCALFDSKQGQAFFPFGEFLEPVLLRELADAFVENGLCGEGRKYFYNTPPKYLEKFPDAKDFFSITADAGEADYIYSVEKLIDSSGEKLRKKRNHIKHFMRECPSYALEPIAEENLLSAMKFAERVSEEMGLEDEIRALSCAKKNFNELGLHGAILRCPLSNIVAMAVFSALNKNTYAVHFEKSLRDVDGTSQMMVSQEAVSIRALGGTYMNREQDLGLENLRRAKESLDPAFKYERLRAGF